MVFYMIIENNNYLLNWQRLFAGLQTLLYSQMHQYSQNMHHALSL